MKKSIAVITTGTLDIALLVSEHFNRSKVAGVELVACTSTLDPLQKMGLRRYRPLVLENAGYGQVDSSLVDVNVDAILLDGADPSSPAWFNNKWADKTYILSCDYTSEGGTYTSEINLLKVFNGNVQVIFNKAETRDTESPDGGEYEIGEMVEKYYTGVIEKLLS